MDFKETPIWNRPRERAKSNIKDLSDAELLAIVLRTGSHQKDVLSLANEILSHFNSFDEIADITLTELLKIKGIGISKATSIMAALEIGKRVNSTRLTNNAIISPEDIYNSLKNEISNLKQEHLYAFYLNTKGHLLRKELISIGTINNTLIDEKTIFRWAYKLAASAIILCHNHPSGNTEPSSNDIIATKRLIKQAEYLGFIVLDHIIVGNNYYSMREKTNLFAK